MSRSTPRRLISGLLALLVAAAVFPATMAQARDRRSGEPFHWDGKLRPGQTLTIRGINGWIHAEPTSGTTAVVDAEKHGERSDPAEVRVEAEETENGIAICARYPRGWGGGLTDCDGHGDTHNNDVVVNFTVRIPAGVDVKLITVNGSIEAEGLDNPVNARTVNGGVRVGTTGQANVATVNGSIVARASVRREDLSLRTVNGSIRLELPSSSNADVSAHTVNGSIDSDFPVTIHRGWVGRSMRGTLGRGGPEIEMSTVNGSIALHEI